MNYVDLFYTNNLGYYPEDETLIKITENTINYLIDCKISQNDIVKVIEGSQKKEYLPPNNLPDFLWKDSLIEKDKFYYHKELQLVSKAPELDLKTWKIITYPFYKEMKIKFTYKDLLSYCCQKGYEYTPIDEKHDIAPLKYLLEKYKAIKHINALDLILFMIDIFFNNEKYVNNLMLMQKYDNESIKLLESFKAEARLKNTDQIVYRGNWLCQQMH